MINHDAIQAVRERAVVVAPASRVAAERRMARRRAALAVTRTRRQEGTVHRRISHPVVRRRLDAVRRRRRLDAVRRRLPVSPGAVARRGLVAAVLLLRLRRPVAARMPAVAARNSPVAVRNPKSASASAIAPCAVRKHRRRPGQSCVRVARWRCRR